jgi:acetyl esterase/lipase
MIANNMKKTILLPLLLIACAAWAQQHYTTQKDIHYYADSINKKDKYIDERCKLDIYYPDGAKDFPTIVWFHGGGLTGGNKELPKQLMEKGYAVIGVGYRLSPKAKAPAYIEDAAAAIAWAFKHIQSYGGSSRLIFLSGHSAGGYLDMMVALDKKYLARYAINADSIAGVIPFSGQMITHYTIREERGIKNTQPIIDEYAPLYHVRPDAPPILLITGDAEMELLGRYEENAYMKRMMGLAGHKRTRLYQLQGFDHGGMAVPAFPLLVKEVAAITKQIKSAQ